MTRKSAVGVAMCVWCSSITFQALAETGTMEFRQRVADKPWLAQGRLSVGGLVGLAGATVSYDFADQLLLGLGAGANDRGPQGAVLLRLRPFTSFAPCSSVICTITGANLFRYLFVEGGLSFGPSTKLKFDVEEPTEGPGPWSYALWAQMLYGCEWVTRSGFDVLIGGGLGIPLHLAGDRCDQQKIGNHCGQSPVALTVTLGLGQYF